MAVPYWTEEQLVQKLMDAGTRLLSPPSSVEDLLPLLDEVDLCLEQVDQSPSQTMQDALSPALKALVSAEVFGHSDADVKVYVATCISEITRITAPDAPYNDDQMKEIFKLTVSCFENLHDTSSRSYGKRAAILETVAKVRSCAVMLDLECDDLILQMFEHFFKSVRNCHPLIVFTSMERIMTLVLEECEDNSPELLSMILGYLKKDDKKVNSPARRLGEKVLYKCSSEVAPYLVQAIQTLGVSLDDYHNVVSSVCQKSSTAVECNEKKYDDHTENKDAVESKSNKDEGELKIKPQTKFKGSSKKRVRRGNLSKTKLAASTATDTVKETHAKEVTDLKESISNESESLHSKDTPTDKRRGGNNIFPKGTLDPFEPTPAEDNDAKERTDLQEIGSKDSLHCKDTPADNTSSSNCDKVIDVPHSLSKASKNKDVDIPSPSSSKETSEESHLMKIDRGTKTEAVIQVITSSEYNDNSESNPDASKSKDDEVTGQETSSATEKEEATLGPVDAPMKDDESTIDSDAKTTKLSVKEHLKPPSKKECKEPDSSPKGATKTAKQETVPASSKKGLDQKSSNKNHVAGKEKASENENHGEELVGSTIKVWWPKDKKFFEGVVESFTPSSKKHKVCYKDGDVEMLTMKKERWELVKVSKKGVSSDGDSPDAFSEMHKKKKIKTNHEPSNKQGKTPSANMTDGGKEANRFKVTVPKPKLSEDKMDVEHNTSSGIDKEVGANQEAEEKQAEDEEADEVEEEDNPDKCHAQVQSLKLSNHRKEVRISILQMELDHLKKVAADREKQLLMSKRHVEELTKDHTLLRDRVEGVHEYLGNILSKAA